MSQTESVEIVTAGYREELALEIKKKQKELDEQWKAKNREDRLSKSQELLEYFGNRFFPLSVWEVRKELSAGVRMALAEEIFRRLKKRHAINWTMFVSGLGFFGLGIIVVPHIFVPWVVSSGILMAIVGAARIFLSPGYQDPLQLSRTRRYLHNYPLLREHLLKAVKAKSEEEKQKGGTAS